MNSTDVVGWAYNTETYCVSDVMIALGMMKSPKAARVTLDHVKTFIRLYGRQKFNLKRDDPRWWDSTEIPQPIFSGEEGDNTCAVCKERLDD